MASFGHNILFSTQTLPSAVATFVPSAVGKIFGNHCPSWGFSEGLIMNNYMFSNNHVWHSEHGPDPLYELQEGSVSSTRPCSQCEYASLLIAELFWWWRIWDTGKGGEWNVRRCLEYNMPAAFCLRGISQQLCSIGDMLDPTFFSWSQEETLFHSPSLVTREQEDPGSRTWCSKLGLCLWMQEAKLRGQLGLIWGNMS